METSKRRVSFLGNFSLIDEEQLISDFTSTILERILKIISKTKETLVEFKADPGLLTQIDWVLAKLNSGCDLYEPEQIDPKYLELASSNKEISKLIEIIQSVNALNDNMNQHSLDKYKKKNNSDNLLAKVEKSEIVRRADKKKTVASRARTVKMSTDTTKEEIEDKVRKSLKNMSFNPNQVSSANPVSRSQTSIMGYSPRSIIEEENSIQSVHFDLFSFAEEQGRKGIVYKVFKYITDFHCLSVSNKLEYFCLEVEESYNFDVPYHNELHACDVTQTLFAWFLEDQIDSVLNLNKLDLLAVFTAAILHDIGHPGLNNNFHVNQQTEMAALYNDKSVLENFHCTEGFKILNRVQSDIFSDLDKSDRKYLRKRIVELILSTDMSQHNKIFSNIKNKISFLEIHIGDNSEKLCEKESKTLFDDQQEVLNFILHCADISHNTKEFSISKKWTDMLHDEFFAQGDREKLIGSDVSFLCDRETVNIPKSQIGFLKGIVIPTFDSLVQIFPDLDFTIDNIDDNLEEWDRMLD